MNFIAAAFHDGVLLYAQAVNETLERGGSITNASAITRQMWNRTFYGGRPVPVLSPAPSRTQPCARPQQGWVLPAHHAPRLVFWDRSQRDGDLQPGARWSHHPRQPWPRAPSPGRGPWLVPEPLALRPQASPAS